MALTLADAKAPLVRDHSVAPPIGTRFFGHLAGSLRLNVCVEGEADQSEE